MEPINISEKAKHGTIIYVEDSISDQKLFEIALKEALVTNNLKLFMDGLEALEFLKKNDEVPFMIISDVNMPRMNGFELKNEIEKDEKLKIKAVPFIYLSASSARKDVKTAFYHQAQGYFEKPAEIEKLIEIIKLVTTYWSTSDLPGFY